MAQNQAIWCLKRKSLNINLFIELLYKINITFVIMLISEEKKCDSSSDFNCMKQIFSAPISRILGSFLVYFNRLNHAVKEHTLNEVKLR